MFRSGKWILPVFVFTICILASCSSLKFVPEDQYLLKKTTIQSEDSVLTVVLSIPTSISAPTPSGSPSSRSPFLCIAFPVATLRYG